MWKRRRRFGFLNRGGAETRRGQGRLTEPTANNRHRWFRFSLRSMIAVTVILILGISHWNTSRELHRTRENLLQLRRETGELVVRDSTKLHVRAQQTTVPREKAFLWRVYVPPGTSYRLSVDVDDVSVAKPGAPTRFTFPPGREFVLKPGEWKIWYEYNSNVDDGRWDTALTLASADQDTESTFQDLPLSSLPWLTQEWRRKFHVAGSYATDTFEADEAVNLLDVLAVPQEKGVAPAFPPESSKLQVRLTPVPLKP